MASSNAATVDAYLAELPSERAEVISAVRTLILQHLPAGYRETMNWGMICYDVPLEVYPHTYNKQPLMYLALAAQKNHYALYLPCAHASPEKRARLRDAFASAGKKLDMGKACLRFGALDQLALDPIVEIIAATPLDEFVALYKEMKDRGDKTS